MSSCKGGKHCEAPLRVSSSGPKVPCACHNLTALAVDNIRKEGRSTCFKGIGKLVDSRCYSMDMRNHTDDHYTADGRIMKGCATSCAQTGVPVGLLMGGMPGNEMYILLTPSIQLAPYMAKMVIVEGLLMLDSNTIFTTCIWLLNEQGYPEKKIKIKDMMG